MRVLIVDDQLMFAQAVRSVLEARGIDVVGIVEAPADAVRVASETAPDVAVVDMEMPNLSGVIAGRGIRRTFPEAKVLGLVSAVDDASIRHVLSFGFQGCVLSDAEPEQLVSAVRSAAAGEAVIPPGVARRSRWRTVDQHTDLLVDLLTAREREVLRMIAQAANSDDIAEHLRISVNTVRSHIQSIFTKLQVHSRLEAAAFASRTGLAAPPGREPGEWASLGWRALDDGDEAEPSSA